MNNNIKKCEEGRENSRAYDVIQNLPEKTELNIGAQMDSVAPGRDLISGPPKFEAEVLTI